MTDPRSTDAKGEIDLEAVRTTRRSGNAHVEREQAERAAFEKIDGRTLRAQRKSRTQTLSTKVKPETMDTIYRIVKANEMSMVDVIETAIAVYDRQLRGVK